MRCGVYSDIPGFCPLKGSGGHHYDSHNVPTRSKMSLVGAKSVSLRNHCPRLKKYKGNVCAGRSGIQVGHHLLSTYCVPGKLQILPTFHQLANRNFRSVCVVRRKTPGLREVKKSSRREIQVHIHLAAKPVPFPSLPTHNFLQVHGVLVLFWNQENPHSED